MDENMAAYYPPPPPASAANYPTFYHPHPPPDPVPPLHVPYISLQQQQQPVHAPYDQVRTLFVAGLPEDIKAREIYILFREFPGYESSNLRQSSQPFAFATFVDQASALAAMHALNGMVFDLEKGSTLYIDLAKSNPRSKRSRTDDERSGSGKRARGNSRGTPDSGFGSVHLPGIANSAHSTNSHSSAQSPWSSGGKSVNESRGIHSHSASPPCPTLFVANLGPNCTEQELIQVFSLCPGFLKLKMQKTFGPPVAFVDFHDTASSTAALNHLQGTLLYSSPTNEGIRLEYAKSRMGMCRKPK